MAWTTKWKSRNVRFKLCHQLKMPTSACGLRPRLSISSPSPQIASLNARNSRSSERDVRFYDALQDTEHIPEMDIITNCQSSVRKLIDYSLNIAQSQGSLQRRSPDPVNLFWCLFHGCQNVQPRTFFCHGSRWRWPPTPPSPPRSFDLSHFPLSLIPSVKKSDEVIR